ncbi:MAG: response regulator [Candidatus Hydrogenedentes bacterium]|nr:response regulator [Candidatus Hydrogenedentota bacterium]
MAEAASDDYVLVVEDGAFMRQLLMGLLKQFGYSVVAVADGVAAIEQMVKAPPRLVLLDLELPKMDGRDVCRWMRQQKGLKDIPVVACSAHAEKEFVFKAIRSGVTDYLCKPVERDALKARIEKYLAPPETDAAPAPS